MQDEDGRPKGRKRKKMAWADLKEKKQLWELAERPVDLAGGFSNGKLPAATALNSLSGAAINCLSERVWICSPSDRDDTLSLR
jgi:hypothetical protein